MYTYGIVRNDSKLPRIYRWSIFIAYFLPLMKRRAVHQFLYLFTKKRVALLVLTYLTDGMK